MKNTKQTQHNLVKNKNRKDAFEHVFYLFSLSGIFIKSNTKLKQRRVLFSTFNKVKNICVNIVLVYCLFISVSYIFSLECSLRLKIAYLTMDLLCIINRAYLCRHIKKLKNLTKITNENAKKSLSKTPSKKHLIYFWSLTTNLAFLLMCLCDTDTERRIKIMLFGYSSKSAFLKHLGTFTYIVCSTILLYMPFITFSIYYTMVCYETKVMISNYKDILKSTVATNYDRFNEIYCRIKSCVKLIDSTLGPIVLISLFMNSVTMYSLLTLILHNSNVINKENVGLFFRIFCAVINLVNFAVQLFTASSIHDASTLIKDKIAVIKENNPQLTSSYLSFVLIHSEEVCMTVWGIVSIKKSFNVGIFGTLLTYCFLFDSMKTSDM